MGLSPALKESMAEATGRKPPESRALRSLAAVAAYVVFAGTVLFLNQQLWHQLFWLFILLGVIWTVVVVRDGPPEVLRRFAFSLRTLFVVVTVLYVWMGWNVNLVQKRRAALSAIQSDLVTSLTFDEGSASYRSNSEKRAQEIAWLLSQRHVRDRFPSTGPCEVSMLRHWLGDEPIFKIVLKDDSELARVRRLFPEAEVTVMDNPGSNAWNEKPSGEPLDISRLPPGELKDEEIERLRLLFPGEL